MVDKMGVLFEAIRQLQQDQPVIQPGQAGAVEQSYADLVAITGLPRPIIEATTDAYPGSVVEYRNEAVQGGNLWIALLLLGGHKIEIHEESDGLQNGE